MKSNLKALTTEMAVWLKACRRSLKLTQQDLGSATGLAKSALSRIESGDGSTTVQHGTWDKLSAFYAGKGCTPFDADPGVPVVGAADRSTLQRRTLAEKNAQKCSWDNLGQALGVSGQTLIRLHSKKHKLAPKTLNAIAEGLARLAALPGKLVQANLLTQVAPAPAKKKAAPVVQRQSVVEAAPTLSDVDLAMMTLGAISVIQRSRAALPVVLNGHHKHA